MLSRRDGTVQQEVEWRRQGARSIEKHRQTQDNKSTPFRALGMVSQDRGKTERSGDPPMAKESSRFTIKAMSAQANAW